MPRHKVNFSIAKAQDSAFALTSAMAQQVDAIAAINGSFFNTKSGESVDFIKKNGQITDTSFTLPKGGYRSHQEAVFAFDGPHTAIIRRDTSLKNRWEKTIYFDHAIESGPLLIWQGQAVPLPNNAFNDNRHPRTCVGISDDAIYLFTADGRSNQAYGLSLPELTQLMKWLGCHQALNFDGGGSTTMYIKDLGVVNMPSDNKLFDHEGERKVANALLVIGVERE